MFPPTPDGIPAALLLEHLPVPLVLLDSVERVLWGNAAAHRAFGNCRKGTPLAELDASLAPVSVPGATLKLALLPDDATRRLSLLASAGAESGALAHEIKNATSAVSLALRAVARALSEDEQAVLADLVARLQGVERRVRDALAHDLP